MLRRVIAGLVVVGLAIGVWLLWPEDNQASPSTTTVLAAEPTTPPPSSAPPTIAPEQSTSTTSPDDRIVDSVEEAEAILRELWFGWFEGIYNQDEERIREVVATEEFFTDALAAFQSLEFVKTPDRLDVVFEHVEVLRSDAECLVIWTETDLTSLLGEGSMREGVDVLRRVEGRWKMATAWAFAEDLWEQDCEARLRPLP